MSCSSLHCIWQCAHMNVYTLGPLTFIVERTMAGFECCSRGDTFSRIVVESKSFSGSYSTNVSSINICPHSVHSFKEDSSLFKVIEFINKILFPSGQDKEETIFDWISHRAATALAMTYKQKMENRYFFLYIGVAIKDQILQLWNKIVIVY